MRIALIFRSMWLNKKYTISGTIVCLLTGLSNGFVWKCSKITCHMLTAQPITYDEFWLIDQIYRVYSQYWLKDIDIQFAIPMNLPNISANQCIGLSLARIRALKLNHRQIFAKVPFVKLVFSIHLGLQKQWVLRVLDQNCFALKVFPLTLSLLNSSIDI